MKNETAVRVCKNKKCQKVLPLGYKHKYCEACRNQQVENVKNIGKVVLGGVGAIASVVVAVVSIVKINPNKK